MRSTVSGANGEGLRTTVLPASSAGIVLQNEIRTGKFHGLMAPTTPIGVNRFVICPICGTSCSFSCNSICTSAGPNAFVSRSNSNRAIARGPPCSAVRSTISSSAWSFILLRRLVNITFRWLIGTARHPENALCAALTALSSRV